MLKEKILDSIHQDPKARTLEEWARFFDMNTSEDMKILQKIFKELEKDYEIVLTKKNKYVLAQDQGIYKGTISMTRSGSGYLDFDDRDSIYIPRKEIHGAMDKDLVVVQQTNAPASDQGKVIAVLERHTKVLVGNIMSKRKPSLFLPDNNAIQIPVRITNDEAFGWPHQKKVQVRILEYHDKYLLAKIEKVLGSKYDEKVEVLGTLIEAGVLTEFPEEVVQEAKSISQEVDDQHLGNRQDLRNQLIVTIDGADAKDLDDAISIEKHEDFYRLGVHIADVSYYVPENSALDQEAYERGTSTYVVDRVVPMLPTALSNGVCSLLPKVNRYTVSCVMDINLQGEIIHYQLFPSLIQSHAKMTYDAVNRILRGHKKETQKHEHLVEMFQEMRNLSDIIRKKREAEGSIDFEKDEAKIIVDKQSRVIDIQLRDRGRAERIIEDFMVCANECVARHMRWLEYPFLYRVHEKPNADKIREFASLSALMGYPLKGNPEDIHASSLQRILKKAKDTEVYPVLSSRMLRSMQKAKYAAECLGHFGLGLKEYTHFTSPIRRYPDLIVHRMLYKYAFPTDVPIKDIYMDEIKMVDIAKQSSLRERVSIEAERAVEDIKKAEYMQGKIGQEFEGMISTILSTGFFVQLANTVEGFVALDSLQDDFYNVSENMMSIIGRRKKKEYHIGQKVWIRVEHADKHTRHIDFELVEKKKAEKKKRR